MSLRVVCILYSFFKFYEILFENHILYEKVISIKIIIIAILSVKQGFDVIRVAWSRVNGVRNNKRSEKFCNCFDHMHATASNSCLSAKYNGEVQSICFFLLRPPCSICLKFQGNELEKSSFLKKIIHLRPVFNLS